MLLSPGSQQVLGSAGSSQVFQAPCPSNSVLHPSPAFSPFSLSRRQTSPSAGCSQVPPAQPKPGGTTLPSRAGSLQAPGSHECLMEAQPLPSCASTLLGVTSTSNTPQKASSGTRTGTSLPHVLLALWLKAEEGCLWLPMPAPARCLPHRLAWMQTIHFTESQHVEGLK